MTPRERWLALLAGERADRIPTDYQATSEVTARLLTELDCSEEAALWRRLRIDKRTVLEPAWKPAARPLDSACDPWGVRCREVDYGCGTYLEPVFHPLAAAETRGDIARHSWPDPVEFDYAGLGLALEEADPAYPVHVGCYEPFLLYGRMRGLERAFEDLACRPSLVEASLGRILDFYLEHHRRCFETGRGRIDLTWVAEDLGSQTGPLVSLATYRRFLLPGQIRMADLARRHGIHVLYHTDGAARPFLPDLIDRVGIEVLNPIQWRCPGMEREGLVRDFGERIVFHGSIDNQYTLARGTLDEVVAEVRQSAEIYAGARWICAPCHNIQPVTSTEKIVALYETIDSISRKGGPA